LATTAAAWPALSTARTPPAVAEYAGAAGGAALLLPALLAAAGPADAALAVLRAEALPAAARAIADHAAAVVAAIRSRAPALRITLDPLEFRGLRYHTGVAFTIFGSGRTGELARGGRYLSGDEPATGMTLYPDAVLRAVAPIPQRLRVFPARGRRCRAGRRTARRRPRHPGPAGRP
jgi:ATP phosphoribosyltransferase regulatory subunit